MLRYRQDGRKEAKMKLHCHYWTRDFKKCTRFVLEGKNGAELTEELNRARENHDVFTNNVIVVDCIED